MSKNKVKCCWCFSAFFGAVVVGLSFVSSETVDVSMPKRINNAAVDETAELMSKDFSNDLPGNARIVSATPKGRGWRQVGTLDTSIDEVEKTVNDLMLRYGFKRRHSIGRNEMSDGRANGVHMLAQYETRTGEKLMWMLWEIETCKTGFSWGWAR